MPAEHIALMLFFGALLGFAVKVPLMPFHTWLPAAYAEAPTGTTMLLTGAMSKMGVYGFLRILLPIFSQQMLWMRKPLLCARRRSPSYFPPSRPSRKRISNAFFAYSSINHLGYCLLGIFAVASSSSGRFRLARWRKRPRPSTASFCRCSTTDSPLSVLFWFVALLEKRSGGLRGLNDFGGLRKIAPVFCGLMGIALFSSLGLPGLNGFVGEFLIFKGVFPLDLGRHPFPYSAFS